MRASSLVVRSALIAALGGLLFGFDTAVISGTVDSLKEVFFLNDWWLGFTVASALIGTILGAATAQIPSNRIGRKPTLIVMAVFYFVSAVGSACPWNLGALGPVDWYLFLAARFLGGIAVGAASVVSPLYTAEISPAKQRGLLVAFTQFNIVLGILLAFFSNFLIAGMNLGDMGWRWMFGVEAFPAAAFFLLLFIVPESPRWLIGKGRIDSARPVIAALGTDEGRDVEDEIRIIREAIDEETRNGKEAFFTWRLRFPIMLAICMAAFNQLSGINAVLYYAPKIFKIAGADEQLAMFCPVIIGIANMVFTMAAMGVIDRFGRRKLMLVGSIGYITSLCIVAGAFITFSSQFDESIARVAVRDSREKIQKIEKRLQELEGTNDESSEFWENELKNSRIELLIAAEESRAPSYKLPEEVKNSRKETLSKSSVEELKRDGDAVLAGPGMETSRVPTTGVLIVLIGLMAFIASHAFGQGACIWVFIGEIFPNKVRAQGQALGCFVHWVLAALITQLFPPLLALFGPVAIFFGFAGFMVLQLLWVLILMPETKQVPLEEMQRKLGIT